jgi:hypothetical protein
MEKNITFKRAIKELDTIIDLSKAEELTKKASKAAEELGFCCVVLDKALIVTNNMGGQTLYTNIKTPENKVMQGLILTHALLNHKLH